MLEAERIPILAQEGGVPGRAAGASSTSLPLRRNRDFLLLWSGQTISTAGSQVSQIAVPLLVLALFHSAALAGLIAGIRLLPYVLLSLPAGALVDRWNRKRVMIVCDTGRAIALAIIPLALALGRLSFVLLVLVTLIEGTLYVFFNLAELASLPRVVPKEQLGTASALNEVGVDIAFIVGPAVGGALFATARKLPFLGDALSYIVSVLSLLGIHAEFQQTRTTAPQPLRTAIREGLVWLLRHPVLRLLALLTTAASLIELSMTLLVVVVATRSGFGAATTGLILAVGSASGLLAAALTPYLQKRYRFGRLVVVSQWLYALALPVYAFASTPLALTVATALFFGVGTVFALLQYTYRLTVVPDELQGRVSSVYRLFVLTGQGIGPVVTGLLLQSVGVPVVVALFCALLVLLAVVATCSQSMRQA